MIKRKSIKLIFPILIILAIILIVIWIILKNNSMPIGTPVKQNNFSAINNPGFIFSLKNSSDQYVSFKYPKFLKVVSNYKFYPPVVDEFNYSYLDIESWDLSISIYHFGSSSLQDNNAYQFRLENPSIYVPSTEVVNEQNVVIFSDQSMGGFNKIAFLVNGTYQATISLTGDDQSGQAPLQKTFDLILSNWHWKV